jgi:hypothetical protein
MAAAALAQHVFSWADMCKRGSFVTSVAAYKFLKSCRCELSGKRGTDGSMFVTEEARDLTNNTVFDWRGDLKYHPDGQQIVGPGVMKFEVRFMTTIEHTLNQRRLEFVVYLAASEQYPFVAHVRVCPRKHPNPKCERLRRSRLRCEEAIPIFGVLSHEIGRIPGIHNDSFFTVADALHPIRLQDIIRPEEASAFLDKLNNDKNQSEWIEDLTYGDVFPWCRFLRCNHRLEADARKLLWMLQYCRITM